MGAWNIELGEKTNELQTKELAATSGWATSRTAHPEKIGRVYSLLIVIRVNRSRPLPSLFTFLSLYYNFGVIMT